MNITWRNLLYVAITLVTGCVPMALNPTVSVMPGRNKSPEAFAAELVGCKQLAEQTISDARNQINNQIAGTVLLNAALGAAQAGAAGGDGGVVAASAAAGGLGASNASLPAVQAATAGLQQQYDMVYSRCMYAKGNLVPGFAVAAPEPQRRRPVQRRAKTPAPQGEAPAAAAAQPFVEPPATVQPASAPASIVEPPPAKQ